MDERKVKKQDHQHIVTALKGLKLTIKGLTDCNSELYQSKRVQFALKVPDKVLEHVHAVGSTVRFGCESEELVGELMP
jgi:hypothetical protein